MSSTKAHIKLVEDVNEATGRLCFRALVTDGDRGGKVLAEVGPCGTRDEAINAANKTIQEMATKAS